MDVTDKAFLYMLLKPAFNNNKYQLFGAKDGLLCFEDKCITPAIRYADSISNKQHLIDDPKKETKSFPAFIKRIDRATGIIDAIVAVIGNIDFGDDIIHPGAFTKTITERGLDIRVLDNHNSWSVMDVVGKPLVIREIGKDELPPELLEKFPDATGGLFTTTQYLMDTPEGAGTFARLAIGAINEYSIGFQIIRQDTTLEQTDEGEREIRNIREIKLFEYSPVIWAMNPATQTISSSNYPTMSAKNLGDSEQTASTCISCKHYGMVTETAGFCLLNKEAVKADSISDGYEANEEVLGALVSEDLSDKLSEFLTDFFVMLSDLDMFTHDDDYIIKLIDNLLTHFDNDLLATRLPIPKEYTIPKSLDEDDKSVAAAGTDDNKSTAHANEADKDNTRERLIRLIQAKQRMAASIGV